MKKNKYLLIAALPLLLVSCNKKDSVGIPTGEKVSETETYTVLTKASEATSKQDSFGFKFTSYFDSKTEAAYTQGTVKQTSDTSTNVKLDANFGVKGFKEEKLKDVEASLVTSGSLELKASNTNLNTSLCAGVYLEDGTLYCNLENLAPLLEFVTIPSAYLTSLKFKTTIPSDVDNSLKDILEDDTWSELIEEIKEESKSFETLKTKDGDYAYVFELDLEKLASSSSTSFSGDVTGSVKCSLLFNDKGFKNYYLTMDVASKFSVDDGTNENSITTSTSVKGEVKLSFLYGDEVSVEKVKDPSSFVEQK